MRDVETHGLQPTVAIQLAGDHQRPSYRIWSLGEICVYNENFDTFKKGVVGIIANMSILLMGCPWSSLCMIPGLPSI